MDLKEFAENELYNRGYGKDRFGNGNADVKKNNWTALIIVAIALLLLWK